MSDRYARQLIVPEVGPEGQSRLAQATVLVVGAGGLGSPVLQYLAAAGVGHLRIVDPDRIEESNLHRQPLYRMSDLGALKVDAARAALLSLRPDLRVTPLAERLTPANVARCLEPVDLAIDAADSFAVTYTLSDACLASRKHLVSASVLGWSGYVGVFCGTAPSYRAVFPELPERAGSCAQNGVLGTAVGVLGTLQAQLALSVVLGLAPAVAGRLITVDLRNLQFGGFNFAAAAEPEASCSRFIDVSAVGADDIVVDLRDPLEAPVAVCPQALRRSAESFESSAPLVGASAASPDDWSHERRIVLCCRTGLRAARAARALQSRGYRQLALIALGP